jgi:thiol-disulfide isomerase/thioredoxin
MPQTKHPRRFALPLLLAATSLAAWGAHPSFAATSLLHKPAPEFVRSALDHSKVDLNAYRGKVVLLDFWATWCASCQIEMPSFVAWQKQYGPQGLQIIGISLDEDPALARSLYSKLKLNYPVVMGDSKLGNLYGGVLGLPLTFLIDRRGQIQAMYLGEADLNQIKMQIQSLLSGR